MDATILIILYLGIIIAILFNVVNGRNDAPNTVAIILATRALSPLKAKLFAAACCLIGPLIFSSAIAKTIGTNLVNTSLMPSAVLLTGVCGGMAWMLFCAKSGLPVSSSHALVGGLIGAGIAAGGWGSVVWPPFKMIEQMFIYLIHGAIIGGVGGFLVSLPFHDSKKLFTIIGAVFGAVAAVPFAMIFLNFVFGGILAIVLFICVSPMMGFFASYIITILLSRFTSRHIKNPMKMNKWFQRLQLVGSAFQALSLGGNDAQHAMGIIYVILISTDLIKGGDDIPFWVTAVSTVAIITGLFMAVKKVLRRVGSGITRLMPYQGFSASFAAGAVLSFMVSFGIPVSSTHLTSGSIMGTGVTKGVGAVNWKNIRSIVGAWIITIPCTAVISFLSSLVVKLIFRM